MLRDRVRPIASRVEVAAPGTPAPTIRAALVLRTLPVSSLALAAAGVAAAVGGSSYLRRETAVPAGLPLGIQATLIALSWPPPRWPPRWRWPAAWPGPGPTSSEASDAG